MLLMDSLITIFTRCKDKKSLKVYVQENLIELIKDYAPDGILLEMIENRPQTLICSDCVNIFIIKYINI